MVNLPISVAYLCGLVTSKRKTPSTTRSSYPYVSLPPPSTLSTPSAVSSCSRKHSSSGHRTDVHLVWHPPHKHGYAFQREHGSIHGAPSHNSHDKHPKPAQNLRSHIPRAAKRLLQKRAATSRKSAPSQPKPTQSQPQTLPTAFSISEFYQA